MKILNTLILSLLFLIVSQMKIQSQELNIKIDKVLQQAVILEQFSGSVLVAMDGKIIYVKAFGEANKDYNIKNTLKTKFNIGSLGKLFTGTAITMLIQRGKLKVSDAVIKYLPDFPYGNKITILHLLSHTSGLSDYWDHPEYYSRRHLLTDTNEILKLVYDQELLFDTPGEKTAYSNSCAVVLGIIIEKITGLKYSEFLKENIFAPLKMNDTGLYKLDDVAINRAVGYLRNSNGMWKSNMLTVPPPGPDGGILSTVEDLYKFDQALYTNQLLDEEYRTSMFTLVKGMTGYLWGIVYRYNNKLVGHFEDITGISNCFMRYLDDKYTIIVLSNYSGGANSVLNPIQAIIFGDD